MFKIRRVMDYLTFIVVTSIYHDILKSDIVKVFE